MFVAVRLGITAFNKKDTMAELTPISIVFLIFPNITQLDVMGPAQVFSRLGNSKIELAWKTLEPIPSDAGFSLLPTATLNDINKADILCIPGGLGTTDLMQDIEIFNWIQSIAKNATWVTSVCTGSLVLGAAGLLKGYEATCHWASIDQLAFFEAIPKRERVVFDRNRVTGAGVTSGIDFALSPTEKIRGRDHAEFVQLSIEYDPDPPFDSGSPDKAKAEIVSQYWAIINKYSPDRKAVVKEIAETLKLKSPN